jgi:hypothetical protein
MRVLACLVLSACILGAKDNTVTRAEAQDGWLLLFDGESLFGWSQDGKKWKAGDGVLTCEAGDCGELRTDSPFSDYVLKFDYHAARADSDASLLFRFAKEGSPADSGYDLRLGDSDGKWPTGSIAQHIKSEAGKLQPNQWHSVELEVTGDELTVTIDGRKVASGKDSKSHAGYIAMACQRGGRYDFRNIKLKPLGLKPIFNATDMSGWKAVNPSPQKPAAGGGGVLKKFGKVFGGGGGDKKPHEASWSLANGAIHGANGPGQLETQAVYDDFLLQVDVKAKATGKKESPHAALHFRGDPGQFQSGYEVSIENGVSTGNLSGLKIARKVLGEDDQFFTATILARGRHVAIWVNGYPVNEFDDIRPEGPAPKKEARTAGGAIALGAPEGEGTIDYQNIKLVALPKTLGGQSAKAVAAALPPVAPVTPAQVAQAPANQQPVVPAMQQMAAGQARDEARQAQVSKLMQEALKTDQPETQKDLYEKILALDPGNVNAATGYKEAQQKIEQTRAQKQKETEEGAKQKQTEEQKAATLAQSLEDGQAAFLVGNIAAAQGHLAIAQRIAPNNPQVQSLKQRVDSAAQQRDRVKYLLLGGGVLVLLSGGGLLLFTRGKKDPFVEVIEGLQKGDKFALDQEIVHIGAVAQDGGSKNDIVLQDVERMISRFHCEIHVKQGKLFLIDCNSSNGTKLDGRRVAPGTPVRLKSGSRVELGGTCALRVGFEKPRKT